MLEYPQWWLVTRRPLPEMISPVQPPPNCTTASLIDEWLTL